MNENKNEKENENKKESENESEKEIWKDIPGYEGRYQVSNTGKVKSMNYRRTGVSRILAPHIIKSGYQNVELSNADKKLKYSYVHRLVWEAFVGPIPEEMEINHKDENKTNNSLENLEIVTHEQNANYGTRNIRARLSKMKPIAKIDIATGEILKKYPSVTSAVKEYGGSVAHAVRGRTKQAYGFEWKLLTDL